MTEIWKAGLAVLLDSSYNGEKPKTIPAGRLVGEMLEHSWRGYMAYRGSP